MPEPETTARLATLEQLRETTFAAFLSPVPSTRILRLWMDRYQIPRFKPNPLAKRGGGPAWYSVAAVEKMLRQRTMLKVNREVAR